MKNIVITGVSTGIGHACAQAFISKGYRIFGSVRKQEDADRLQNKWGDLFCPLLFDVRDEASVLKEAVRVKEILNGQGLDGLINNAGIAVAGPLMHLPIDQVREQLDINITGLLITTQAFLPMLGAQKDFSHTPGTIFNISSVAGKFASPFMGAYAASKHAVEALSGSLRIELMLYGIDVVVIGPGVVKTPIWQKADEMDLSYLDGTDYKKASGKIMRFVKKMATTGYDETEFGQMLVQIFEKKKRKTRYAMVANYLSNWLIPRTLPTRTINKVIAKRLGFLK